jgi:hypothetical protein
VLKGGAGVNTFVFTAMALTATDKVTGGTGANNELLMTTAGTVAAAGVSGVENYVLADSGANTLTLATADFIGVTGSTITVSDGNPSAGFPEEVRRRQARGGSRCPSACGGRPRATGNASCSTRWRCRRGVRVRCCDLP